VRALFFVTDWDRLTYSTGDNSNTSDVRVLALIWTYPMLNFILMAYTANSRWVYELMILMNPVINQRILRRTFNVFICALITFCLMMYLFYVIALPVEQDYSDLANVFWFIAVFDFICAAVLGCSILLYIRRMQQLNPVYG